MKSYLAVFRPLVFGACLYAQGPAAAEEQLPVPSAAQASDHFDPLAATNAYLATVPPDKKARSDAYFEGGYWLLLWDFLASAAVYFLLLSTGWSARMRDLAERITRFKPLQTFLYWVQFLTVTSVIVFPLTAYEGFVREHAYGLATQAFGPWLGDRSEEHTSELQSLTNLVCRLLLEKKKKLPYI